MDYFWQKTATIINIWLPLIFSVRRKIAVNSTYLFLEHTIAYRKIGKLQVVAIATVMQTGSIAVSMKERVKAKLGGEKTQTAGCISAVLTDSKHFLPHD